MRRGGTIFLGNSITEYGDWQRLLHDARVINRGIAGDNTFGILDRLLRQLAGVAGFTYIDLAGRLTDPSGELMVKYAQPDGLHLNGEGYAVFVGMIKK
ncbi:MAG TPA: hypothetical protein VHD83_15340 [Puia sp.]|nr:hypothetical protein [Puia sp.]